jgi:signal transduction histidine kinase
MRIKLIFTIVVTAISLKSYPQSNIDSLLSLLESSVGIQKVDILNLLTDSYKLNNTNEARNFALQASIMAENLGYERGAGYAAQNLGYIEYLYGNFNEALRYSDNASEMADKLSDPELKLRTYEVIALTYEEMGENENSLRFFQRSFALNQSMKNHVGAGLSLLGIGRIYGNMGTDQLSLESNLKSLDIFLNLKNNAGIAKSSMAIAKNYFRIDNYDSMAYFYTRAEELIRQMGSKELLLELYLEKYQVYMVSYTDSSLNYLQKAIALSGELGRIYLKRDLLLKTSDLYSKRGEYQLAYDYHQMYVLLNDSLTDSQGAINTEKLRLTVNDAIYSEQQEVFKEFESLNKKERDQYRIMVYGFGLIILFISAILILLILRYYSQKKSVAKMQDLYNEIESLSNEISKKQEIILNLHDKNSKNNVGTEVHVSNEMVLAKSREKSGREMSETEFLNQANQQFISKQWTSLQGARDRLRYKKEYFKLEDILSEDWEYVNLDRLSQSLIDSTKESFDENIKIHHNADPNLNVFCHKESMLLLIYLLLQNAIEAISKEGDIYIDYYSDKEKVVYRIIDTGCGISLDDKSQIFAPFYSTKKQEDHFGLGLSVCQEIIKKHKAVIKVKSKPGLATEFGLEFYYD